MVSKTSFNTQSDFKFSPLRHPFFLSFFELESKEGPH